MISNSVAEVASYKGLTMNNNVLLKATSVMWLLLLLFSAMYSYAAEHEHQHGEYGDSPAGGKVKQSRHSMRDAVLWTDYPTLKIMRGGEMGSRHDVMLLPKNIVPDSIDAYSSNVKAADAHRQLPYDLVMAKLGSLSSGGFIWLSARQEAAGKVIVASTVHYVSERGSKNPTAMFMQQKNALEIIPQPYPREHTRYRSNEDWKFLVRFNSLPLIQQKVILMTQNGSKISLLSDVHGMVTAHIPDDFKTVAEISDIQGNRSRRSSEFVLATEHLSAGKTYITAFNGQYAPDAFSQRSVLAGLGFMLAGMAGATPLLRNRRSAKKTSETAKGAL